MYRGFLRAPDGTITKFDAPSMGTGSGQGLVEVFGMTPWLEVVGDYLDSNYAYHAFVRTPRGKITPFACPSAGPGGTAGESLNPAGLISAAYLDVNGTWHGCIGNPDGTFDNYDPPDTGTGSGQGMYPTPLTAGVGPDGTIVGEYMDNNWVVHGYIRAPDGKITEYDNPTLARPQIFKAPIPSESIRRVRFGERTLTRASFFTGIYVRQKAASQKSTLPT